MPITYQTSILFLLKGLSQGNFLHSFLYQILFFFFLAVSLACDPSTLPRGVRISKNGPVLKLTCDPGLQPLETAYTATAADLLFPVPSKRKFARYICMDGASYQRINAQGIERSFFFCTDGQDNLCDPLENSADRGHLQVEGAVAIWRPVVGSQQSILYCAHGVWHRLGGGPLPYGVTVKSQKKGELLTAPVTTESPPTGTGNKETITTISTTIPLPPSHANTTASEISRVDCLHLPSRPLPSPASPQAHISFHPPRSEANLPDPKSIENLHIATANIIVFAESISLAMHDQFHKCTRIAFYCMIVIGTGALIAGVSVLLLLCRRSRLAANVVEAQERLKKIIVSV